MTIQPLSAMTAALQALLEQQRALDQREVQEEGERFGSPSERDMNLQAINHLERAMACVAAQEPRDAVIQVLIAAGHTQVLEQESCEQPLAEELGIVLKLLRSALPVLARHTEVDIEGFGASHYGLGSNAIRAPRAVRPGNGRPAGTTGPSDDPDDHP